MYTFEGNLYILFKKFWKKCNWLFRNIWHTRQVSRKWPFNRWTTRTFRKLIGEYFNLFHILLILLMYLKFPSYIGTRSCFSVIPILVILISISLLASISSYPALHCYCSQYHHFFCSNYSFQMLYFSLVSVEYVIHVSFRFKVCTRYSSTTIVWNFTSRCE